MAEPSARDAPATHPCGGQRRCACHGVMDYGSSSEGRADEWSDLDLLAE